MKKESIINKNWRERNPEKNHAHIIVDSLTRNGKLKKNKCEKCGIEKVEGHHKDYSKPSEVTWLCHKHHREIHTLENRKNKPIKEKKERIRLNSHKSSIFIEEAVKLRDSGMKYKDIANKFNISVGTAYKWINKVSYF